MGFIHRSNILAIRGSFHRRLKRFEPSATGCCVFEKTFFFFLMRRAVRHKTSPLSLSRRRSVVPGSFVWPSQSCFLFALCYTLRRCKPSQEKTRGGPATIPPGERLLESKVCAGRGALLSAAEGAARATIAGVSPEKGAIQLLTSASRAPGVRKLRCDFRLPERPCYLLDVTTEALRENKYRALNSKGFTNHLNAQVARTILR